MGGRDAKQHMLHYYGSREGQFSQFCVAELDFLIAEQLSAAKRMNLRFCFTAETRFVVEVCFAMDVCSAMWKLSSTMQRLILLLRKLFRFATEVISLCCGGWFHCRELLRNAES